jgi:hypothetical protein
MKYITGIIVGTLIWLAWRHNNSRFLRFIADFVFAITILGTLALVASLIMGWPV